MLDCSYPHSFAVPVSSIGLKMASGGARGPCMSAISWVSCGRTGTAGPQGAPALQLGHEGVVVPYRDDGVAVVGRLDVDAVERVGRARQKRPGAADAPHVGIGNRRARPRVHDDEAVFVELDAVAADGQHREGHEGRDGQEREPAPRGRGA